MQITHPISKKLVAEMPEDQYQSLLICMKLLPREQLTNSCSPIERKVLTIEYFRQTMSNGRKRRQ